MSPVLEGGERCRRPLTATFHDHPQALLLPASRQAALALSAIGPVAKQAVPALKEALNDENQDVREAAAYALEAIEPAKPK